MRTLIDRSVFSSISTAMERRHPRLPPTRPLVLIVDGHDDTRELYAVALASFGFDTVTVGDGARAFGRAWLTHPDIIVTEIALPELDGWCLVEDLKREPRTRDIPIVVLTGHAESSVRERAGREGCATVMIKPCLPELLATGLRAVLRREPSREHAPLRS
jgi:CheY-like chemotaxis protein